MKKSLFKTSGNSWEEGGSSKTPLEQKILGGGGGCKSKCLPWEGYGYFLELHITSLLFDLNYKFINGSFAFSPV